MRIVSDSETLRTVFEPDLPHIEPDDRVTWINEADEEHNVVTFRDGYPCGSICFGLRS